MATVTLLAQQTVNAGPYQYGPASLPDSATSLTLSINHGGGVVPGMWWGVCITLDGGTTWKPVIAAATFGQQSDTNSSVSSPLPAGTGRQAKAFLWVLGSQAMNITATVI